MNQSYTKLEKLHLEAVKSLPCSVCDVSGPSEAHHVDQECAYTVIALCTSCHRCPHNGIHGRKAIWKIKKMDEIKALNVTIKRLMENQR